MRTDAQQSCTLTCIPCREDARTARPTKALRSASMRCVKHSLRQAGYTKHAMSQKCNPAPGNRTCRIPLMAQKKQNLCYNWSRQLHALFDAFSNTRLPRHTLAAPVAEAVSV